MLGQMQRAELTVDAFLEHAATWHGDREAVARTASADIVRVSYRDLRPRAMRVSNLLQSLGVTEGDRIATLAWNDISHLEIWYGSMGAGVICHTLNPRFSVEQLAYVINHAGDRILPTFSK